MIENKFDFENALTRLEEITISLEKGEIKLDNALGLFEEGISLARKCEKKLSQAERKVEILRINDEDLAAIEDSKEAELNRNSNYDDPEKKRKTGKNKKKPTLDLFPDLEDTEN